ncbi:MAG: hypothetical protein CL920_07540 [Deltaproteobacteria bacterium]|nr:hypothetical protein [Deltaproteobacteria bacterium]MBU48531.1 hypothetical protein [Deltaproteobacteria bacterium]|tara:strand:+ start:520 stop:2952 length:2433 start_codon:yes stop_codon:yes gene_type:complete
MMDTIQLDDLRLVRKIATGGMAEVWEARQVGVKGFEKRLAVKVILPHLNENDDFIHMFLDEGRLAAQLNHSNICQVYKLGATDDFYYMAMEFIDGVGLSSILREASRRGVFIPFQHCCQVLIGACAGLDYAHSCKDPNGNPLNLVHRDISPQNIMITYNGTVKVVDFGIAKAATQVHHTQVGVLKGKYAYMSPEQAAGHTLDGRSDVFALGIVLWEMTTGHRLFRAENEIATLHKIIGGDYDPPSSFRDDYPPELELIVMKALAVNVNERFQDAGELQIALEDFLLRHGMAAGSKRLAHYVRWITSDDETPAPKELSSQLGVTFDRSESGLITPPPGRIVTTHPTNSGLTPIGNPPSAPRRSAPTEEVDLSEISLPDVDQPKKKGSLGLSIFLIFMMLLLVAGVGAGVYFATDLFRPPVEPSKQQILWLIRSTPPNVDIFVNGEKKGRTPKMLPFLVGERYIIRLYKRGFEPFYKQINAIDESITSQPLVVPMKKIQKLKEVRYGTLVLAVKPEGSEVVLNGKMLKAISGGFYTERIRAQRGHTLIVQQPGYVPYLNTFKIPADQRTTFDIQLQKEKKNPKKKQRRRRGARRRKGRISVRVNIRGVAVYINGRYRGRAPLSRKLRPGTYLVMFKKRGYRTLTKSVRVEGGEREFVRARMVALRSGAPKFAPTRQKLGKLQVGAFPSSKVYVDGKLLGVTPLWGAKVPVGSHSLRIVTRKFGAVHTRPIKIGKGTTKVLHRFRKGRLWVLTRPRAKVYLNGSLLGPSNRPPYVVPAGRYAVRFVFPNGQTRQKRAVVIHAGLKTRITQKLK